jgi:hypothetical protein
MPVMKYAVEHRGDAMWQDSAAGLAAIGKGADAARKNACATMDSTGCGVSQN